MARIDDIIRTGSQNPYQKPNRQFLNALYMQFHGRMATDTEFERFKNMSVKDTANIVAGKEIITPQTISQYRPIQRENKTPSTSYAGAQGETEIGAGEANGLTPSQQQEYNNLMQDIENDSNLSVAEKAVLKEIVQGDYVSGQKIPQGDELNRIIQDASIAAEADISPYYAELTRRELEDLKNSMANIRAQSQQYIKQEKMQYADLLAKTKQSLRARGLTFSGAGRRLLGNEGIIKSNGVEGVIPTNRQLAYESKLSEWQNQARNIGVKAERQLGSDAFKRVGVEQITTPYGTSALYTPTGGITGDLNLARKKAIEQSKWQRVAKYKPYL